MASKADVLIGFLHGSTVDAAFMDSVVTILVRDRFRRVDGVLSLESGPYITEARNQLAQMFLGTSAKWLLMTDADMDLPADVVPRLLRHATPSRIVGGLCFSYSGRTRDAAPVMFDPETGKRIVSWAPGALVPVGFVGGACLMIHRNILEKTPYPWFANDPGGVMDQDQVFCHRVRTAGFKIAVDTSTVIGHCKRIVVTDADYHNPGDTSSFGNTSPFSEVLPSRRPQ